MPFSTDITNTLNAEDVIPDILPTGTIIRHNLKVSFPKAKLDRPGQMIAVNDTQPKPTVFVDPPIEADTLQDIYTLMMVDPDLTHRHDTRFGQVRHWLVTNCSVSSAGEIIDLKARTLSPWIGPAPIPAHHIAEKPHPSRYTFILCKTKSAPSEKDTRRAKLDDSILQDQYEGLASELGSPSQDLFDRSKFNAQQFIQANNLEVVAATFMLVEGDITSGVRSAGLVANAAGNKIVGMGRDSCPVGSSY
ncbi:hypothetical protein UA08_02161 [Talaromyces atroroseus]|uniref:Phosphatidylethanolamine-binding protein n=1 Tax=Talaromyces atroroseus TaxID=1441469 RepID=A0A225ARN3_TALAT|nr:hypothetical protein UA08_02161 [Talaromyces atroroseus]OKL62163.1 hypothetical protein UA08_02161 [Talaromyces atroroseus]